MSTSCKRIQWIYYLQTIERDISNLHVPRTAMVWRACSVLRLARSFVMLEMYCEVSPRLMRRWSLEKVQSLLPYSAKRLLYSQMSAGLQIKRWILSYHVPCTIAMSVSSLILVCNAYWIRAISGIRLISDCI